MQHGTQLLFSTYRHRMTSINTFLLRQSSKCKITKYSCRFTFGVFGEEELKTGKFCGYQFSSDNQMFRHNANYIRG